MASWWSSFVLGAWRQLPVEMVIVAAAAAGAIGLVHGGPEVWCLRLLLTGLVATSLAFAAHRLERFSTAAGDVERIDLVRYTDALAVEVSPATGGSAPGDGLWLGPDRVELRAGGAVVAWVSIAALITHPDATGALPVQTRPLARADGTPIAELAIEELELRQALDQAPGLARITGIVVWRPQPASPPTSPRSWP